MIQKNKLLDLLLVESSPIVIETFKEIGKIFNLKIRFASSINEFIELSKNFEFKYVFTNLHIEYNFSGLFLSRMYNNIRKIRVNDGKMYLFSLQNNPNLELAKLGLDDFAEEKFLSLFDFLEAKFNDNFLHYFETEEFKQSVMAIS